MRMPKATLTTLIAALLVAAPASVLADNQSRGIPIYKKTFFSKAYEVDRIYKSMQGPQSTQRLTLRAGPPELLWLRAYRTEIVGPDSDEPVAADFMCHNNLNLADPERHSALFGAHHTRQPRQFTLSQGQMDVVFPKGFGIPIVSDEPLLVATQVLNHNLPDADFSVRHKTTIEYIRDSDLKRPMKALFQRGVEGLVLLEGHSGHPNAADGDEHGEGCNLGAPAGTARNYTDAYGRVFNGHWIVPPGRDVNRTPVTAYLRLDRDTTVHYIAVHLHPFAESLELRDQTTGETVFKSTATNPIHKIGLGSVEHFSSAEGLPLYKGHEYELVSVYNNTSDEPQDSMAVMFLYHWDREFEKPDLGAGAGGGADGS
jgi:hypothetical protein